MSNRRAYNLDEACPEVRDRVKQTRERMSRIVGELNRFLSDKGLEMSFSTWVFEAEARGPASATLRAWLNCGLVKPEEMAAHLVELAEAEAKEARHKLAGSRR